MNKETEANNISQDETNELKANKLFKQVKNIVWLYSISLLLLTIFVINKESKNDFMEITLFLPTFFIWEFLNIEFEKIDLLLKNDRKKYEYLVHKTSLLFVVAITTIIMMFLTLLSSRNS